MAVQDDSVSVSIENMPILVPEHKTWQSTLFHQNTQLPSTHSQKKTITFQNYERYRKFKGKLTQKHLKCVHTPPA